jgi:hypothetical protein
MMAGCTCRGERPRCSWCVQNTFDQLAGVAEVRGSYWSDWIAYRHRELLTRDWPETERMRAIASSKVADIADPVLDPVLHVRFVERAIHGARKRWAELRRSPDRARQLRPDRSRR